MTAIGPFLDIWGASREWCIFDIFGLWRDICADDVGPIQRSGAEWRRPMGEFVFFPTSTHVPLVFSEDLRPCARAGCPGGIFRRANAVFWPGGIPEIGADEDDREGCTG